MVANDDSLKAVQIGMNSSDVAGSLRLYAELGFLNAGGHFIWGPLMSIQGLQPEARGQMAWLIGRQERVQLEIFHLTNPAQRPLRQDWRCCDLGWTRFGIAVPDLAASKAVLATWGIPLMGELALPGDVRRLAFRDPFIGCFVELIEDGEAVPGGRARQHFDAGPALVYATSSVSDLEAARSYYTDVLGMELADDIVVHQPGHEVLWGLDGAKCESFVVAGGGFLLEIAHYLNPVGRPRPADYTVADQGILNVAVASTSMAVVEETVRRVREKDYAMSDFVKIGDAGGAYILEPEREVEVASLLPEHEAIFGYVPAGPFLGQ